MTWDYKQTEYDKQAKADSAWHIERLINYGLGKEKLERSALESILPKIKISDDRRAFLELLLWNKPF